MNETKNTTVKDYVNTKIDDIKTKVYTTKWRISTWCKENKETIMVFGPVIGTGVIEIVKIIARSGNNKGEKNLKERYIYDRKNGHYFETKRKLKNSEFLEIDRRTSDGESLGDVLDEMNVLK